MFFFFFSMDISMVISYTAMGHQTTRKIISRMISALCLKKSTSSVLLVRAADYVTLGLAIGKANLKGHAIKYSYEFLHFTVRA